MQQDESDYKQDVKDSNTFCGEPGKFSTLLFNAPRVFRPMLPRLPKNFWCLAVNYQALSLSGPLTCDLVTVDCQAASARQAPVPTVSLRL